MDRTERFYRIDQMIQERTVVPLQSFLDELEVSRATFKRDLDYMRERFNAPIEYDRDNNGYRFSDKPRAGPRYQLPGLWFNASEVHALLTMQELLKGLDPGILAPHVEPLMERLNALLDPHPRPLSQGRGERESNSQGRGERPSIEEIKKRIRIVRMAARGMKLEFFELAATATLKRLRLAITFWSRHSDKTTERVVSPQRLVFYRGNWYLDAWCHLREGIRSFGLDGIRAAKLLADKAKNVPEAELDDYLATSYGIFAGRPKGWAKLRFSPTAARWVAHEKWHSKQRSRFETDGGYILEVPFGDDRELVMDILKYGPECRVLEPKELAEKVAELAKATVKLYGG
ncbi:MAG: YafY family transcriptional regulator [Burkholderiales bacterium]|nr:YafY family transcriptional regulator [Burkholderiales bacterium]